MPRTETDKEDLIADGTAMCPRAEYFPTEAAACPWKNVTVGIRQNGAVSIYLDQDPFYQFDADSGLRRAYVSGFLFRSDGQTLTKLHRSRRSDQTTLVAEKLSECDLAAFREHVFQDLTTIRKAWKSGNLQKQRSIPEDVDPAEDVILVIDEVLGRDADRFLSPAISPR